MRATSCSWLTSGLCGLLLALPVAADTPRIPAEPLLRISANAHTAIVRRISVDRLDRYLVSGSEDKTVRVWNLASGALERVIRIPIGVGSLGKVYAVALSPDGQEVAIGGFTGEFSGAYSIFVFDRETGRMKHRLRDLGNVIPHLRYSPDGYYLAATLAGGQGLRVYQTRDYAEIGRDTNYGGPASYWADFDRTGRLVTSGYDGKLRRYDGDFSKPALTRSAPGGERPYGVAFSPDGDRLAVGYSDSTRVDVLSAATLEPLYAADTADVTAGDLGTVAWSPDGRYLFAGGRANASGSDKNILRRWETGVSGGFVDFTPTSTTIMGIVPLADGRLALGTQDAWVGVLAPDGRDVWASRSTQADFRGQEGRGGPGLQVSRSGAVVEFGFEFRGRRRGRFHVATGRLELEPAEDVTLRGPRLEAPGLEVTDWNHEYSPKLNGKTLKLDRDERSRSLAIAPDGRRLVLGSDWSLRVFDADGEAQDEAVVPGIVWSVNITPDGRKVIAGFGDGTVRWYALGQQGKLSELLALYALPDGRWVTWTPTGYYQASAGAESLIGWHVNNGAEAAADFYSVARFRDQFYRPDVIAAVLAQGDEAKALAYADRKRGERTITRDVRGLRPPTVTILAPARGEPVRERKVTLMYEAESPVGGIVRIEARVDSRRANVLSHNPIYRNEGRYALGQITVEVPPSKSVIELLAYNDNGASEAARFPVNWQGQRDFFKPDLYVLAVGVSSYREKSLKLDYAAKDARDFVRAIKRQKGSIYKKVHVNHLDDTKATRNAIEKGLEWLEKQTTSRDVAMVFLSGHGVTDAKGRYRFLPVDFKYEDRRTTTITGGDLEEFLEAVAGKTLFFFDTCYSGNAYRGTKGPPKPPDVDRVANELAEAAVGVVVFSSTTQGALAQELDEVKQGAFTKALLEGIEEGKADFTNDFFVSVAELELYVSDRVKELTKGAQKPVTTKPSAIADWNFIRVGG